MRALLKKIRGIDRSEDLDLQAQLIRADRQWIAMFLVLIAFALAFTISFGRISDLSHKNENLISTIQDERAQSIFRTCQVRDSQNRAILGFIQTSIPKKRLHSPLVKAYLRRAAQVFPPLNCHLEVERNAPSAPAAQTIEKNAKKAAKKGD